MGLPGVYVGRKTAALLVLVLAALLLLLGALGALYGLCRRRGAAPAPPTPGPTEPAQTPAPTSPPGPTRPPGPWSGARLPRSLRPLHYELELWPRARPGLPGAPPAFTGRVNITVRCSRDTAAAVLHSAGLRYEPPPAVRGPRGPVEVARLWLEERRQYAVLELRQALRAGGRYVLQLAFQGALDEDPHGLFLTRYTDRGRPSMLIASQLEPTYARTVFPCFDEPDMKATFNIRIVHDPSYVALSNMPAIGVSEMKDENGSIWTVTTFDTTPKMSTYITAFVVCDFDHMTVTERGKEIRIWARKEAVEKGCVDYALNITGPIFSFLEDLFNISYPLPKTDLVALPDFGAGAMENWGLMTFQESSLIYCPAENLINRKAFVSLIVSHEIGHQWFGNLVTMSWWNDLWLNEGFASYFEYVGAKYVEPKPPLDHMFYESVLQPVLRAEDAMSDRSLSQKEEKVKGTFIFDSLFDIVTYNKGASVIWMLSSFLTERLFLKALNSYLKAFSFSSANQDDLWTHIQMIIDAQNEVQLPASVKNIMDPWTCQDGFPVLTFDPSTGTISQEQFHNIRKKENTTSYNNTWIVPISWVRNGSSQPIVWLDETSKIFPEMQISGSEHDWILLNMNLSGYYRVNYNSSYLKRIGKLLENNPEVFPLVNRLQLIDDAFSLTESGYLEIESALDLTKYLAKENDIFVWYIVLSNLMPNDLECTLKDYEIYPLLKKYLIKKMLPVYHYYAGIIRQNADVLADNYFAEAYLEQLLRKACWLGLQDCLDLCSELYAKWMENPKNQIPAFVRRTIFCYGIAMGSDKEWEFAWEMYHHDNSTTHDKDILLYAMGCTRESWLLHRYMQSGINGSLFSSNNTIFLIYNLAATDTGLRIIWKFMTENWPLLQERFGNAPLHAVLNGMKRLVNTDLQIQELQLFYNATLEENESISTTTRLQSAKLENKERAKLIARVTDWLQKNIDD